MKRRVLFGGAAILLIALLGGFFFLRNTPRVVLSIPANSKTGQFAIIFDKRCAPAKNQDTIAGREVLYEFKGSAVMCSSTRFPATYRQTVRAQSEGRADWKVTSASFSETYCANRRVQAYEFFLMGAVDAPDGRPIREDICDWYDQAFPTGPSSGP